MSTLCELASQCYAHASGALWFEASRTAVIADAHLGYGWAQRRRGELGPVADTKSHPKLQALIDELRPRRLVFLGDLVHAPRPGAEERTAIEAVLRDLAARAEIVVVRGNHDRAFARDFGHFGFQMVEAWIEDGVAALHGDRLKKSPLPALPLVLGHFHPIINLRDAAGARQKLRLFLVSPRVTVLPAFSPYAAGFDITKGLPHDLRELIGSCPLEGVAVTGLSALRIGPIAHLPLNLAAALGPGRRT